MARAAQEAEAPLRDEHGQELASGLSSHVMARHLGRQDIAEVQGPRIRNNGIREHKQSQSEASSGHVRGNLELRARAGQAKEEECGVGLVRAFVVGVDPERPMLSWFQDMGSSDVERYA